MTKTKLEKMAYLATSIKAQLGERTAGWSWQDSGAVGVALIRELPGRDGNPLVLSRELEETIQAAFEPKFLQLQTIKDQLKDVCDIDKTTEAQLLQLLDPEETRKQLVDAKLLVKKPRSKGKLLKDLMPTEDDEE